MRARTTPRKQPTQARAKATVDAILTATARVLVKEGYDRTSTNKVALAAGVSVGSLYQYFPSKEALVAALMERYTDQLCDRLHATLSAVFHQPVEQVAEVMIRELIALKTADARLHRVLTEEVPRLGRLRKLSNLDNRLMGMLREYLEANRGAVRPSNLDAATFVLGSLCTALATAIAADAPAQVNTEALVEEFTSLVQLYLAPPRAEVGSVRVAQ